MGYGWVTYDRVTFISANTLTELKGFVVNGFDYKPDGLFYDAELIVGSPSGSLQTTNIQSDVRLQLEYWNGHNYQMVTNTYNFGSNTAEGIQNVLSQTYYYPDNGTIIAKITLGPGGLGTLYTQSQIGIIDIQSPLSSGVLSVKNASNPSAAAWQYPFVNGEVTVTLMAGYFDLQLYQNGALYDEGKFTVAPGQYLRLQAPLGNVSISSARAKVQELPLR